MRLLQSTLLLLSLLASTYLSAQQPGDTIKVRSFNYTSPTRDSVVEFPSTVGLTFEKIIMKYSMRCKGARVSTSANRNLGCGEWDYSCNTFIVDSNKVEQLAATHPTHIISNFSGTTFNYTNNPVQDYYDYALNQVTTGGGIGVEVLFPVGSGSATSSDFLRADQKSGKTYLLYSASDLLASGSIMGNLEGLILDVANAGGQARFMKMSIKHLASNATLDPSQAPFSGMQQVYNDHFTFVNGANRVYFHTPFVYDGTSSLLVEISFTNTMPSTPISFNCTDVGYTAGIFANNNYAVNLASQGHIQLNGAPMSSVSNQMTVAFWAFGDANALPANTSVIYGTPSASTDRHLNIHLPWSNSSVYFDCGYSAGGFDRIDKAAVASEFEGQWNHWVFTKNVTTGSMKIYLNGTLWHSGTGKTKPIVIQNLILGKSSDMTNNYKGRVNELSIWNTELTAANISAWMKLPIQASHPQYANLVSYYRMAEGNGQMVLDTKTSTQATGENLQWTYDRGESLNRTFFSSTLRPNVTFLRGNYNITNTPYTSRDSVVRPANSVTSYNILDNSTAIPLRSDEVQIASTVMMWEATPSLIFNGNTGAQTGQIPTGTQGSINIGTLNYVRRFPYYNEIMSFVTPYGIGLDLGPEGKSWFYDVSDFEPILKGKKRMVMSMGGQNQEENDIEFWFIVGTPPRNVLDFNQLWQSAGRLSGVSINNIVNNTQFAPVNVALSPNGQEFKIRSTITGHGAEGEFQANGGNVSHFLNLDGGSNEFTWSINRECSFNPIFPQGGTWVYDRQGWCPGEVSYTKESSLAGLVNPGDNISIDYGTTSPPNPAGDYRYLVAHQLVTYGGANHNLDARIIDIQRPTDKVLYSRVNPMCAKPAIVVQNTGATSITSLRIDYWVNNPNHVQSFNWTGLMDFMESTTIQLPIGSLWNGMLPSGNVFHAEIIQANGSTDNYALNNKMSSPFVAPIVLPGNITVEFRSNNRPSENLYRIYDENNAVVATKTFPTANLTYTDNYNLNGCYRILLTDTGQDGINWWANTAQGTGLMRIKNSSGAIIYTFQPDFGGQVELNFTTNSPLDNEEAEMEAIALYPNPTSGMFILEGFVLEDAQVMLVDMLGREVQIGQTTNNHRMELDASGLAKGMYFVQIRKAGRTAVKKLLVE